MQDNLARPLAQPVQVPKKKVKTAVKRKTKPKQKFRWGLSCLLLFFFSLSMLLVVRYAAIAEQEKEIAAAKAQFEKLESQNIAKKVQIQQSINIEQIEKTAKEKLGMVKPGKNQVVNIQVPVDNQAEVMADTQSSPGIFGKAKQFIGNIVAYLH